MNSICERLFNNSKDSYCKNFLAMSSYEKFTTVAKTTLVATACGTIANSITAPAVVTVFFVVGGVAAFHYMTRNYQVISTTPRTSSVNLLPQSENSPVTQSRAFNESCYARLKACGSIKPGSDLYQQYPDLISDSVPLNALLESRELPTGEKSYKKKVFLKASGLDNNVKIVCLKGSVHHIAIRRSKSEGLTLKGKMDLAKKQLSLYTTLSTHKNFVQIYGMVAKTRKNNSDFRVYTLLEKIEITDISNRKYSKSEAISLLNQLNSVIDHLLKHRIHPKDLAFRNFTITPDATLKFYDFDDWLKTQAQFECENGVYDLSQMVIKHICENTKGFVHQSSFDFPEWITSDHPHFCEETVIAKEKINLILNSLVM